MNPRMCACCYDKSRTDIGQFICPSCVQEFKVMNRLYSLAALHFDSVKKMTLSQFFQLMFQKLELDKKIKESYNRARKLRKR